MGKIHVAILRDSHLVPGHLPHQGPTRNAQAEAAVVAVPEHKHLEDGVGLQHGPRHLLSRLIKAEPGHIVTRQGQVKT